MASRLREESVGDDEFASGIGLDEEEGLDERLRLLGVTVLPNTSTLAAAWPFGLPAGDDGERFMEDEEAAAVEDDAAGVEGDESLLDVEAGDEDNAFWRALDAEDEEGELETAAELGDLDERRLTFELASLVGGVGGGSLKGSCRPRRSSEDDVERVLLSLYSFPVSPVAAVFALPDEGESTKLRLFLLFAELFLLGELDGSAFRSAWSLSSMTLACSSSCFTSSSFINPPAAASLVVVSCFLSTSVAAAVAATTADSVLLSIVLLSNPSAASMAEVIAFESSSTSMLYACTLQLLRGRLACLQCDCGASLAAVRTRGLE